jgi:glycosyltransferase involved in cell wall biosynthesis
VVLFNAVENRFDPALVRIVHIITRLILGGAQENTLLTVEEQHRTGDHVTLITGPPLGPEGSLLERAYQKGLDVQLIDSMRRSVHPWRDWITIRRLVRILRQLNPDVVHTHSSKAGILGRAAAAQVRIPAIIHSVHGSPFHPYERWWRNKLYITAERWAARRTTAFICVSDAMTDQYVDAGIAPRDRFTTIYSGMEVNSFLTPRRPREDVRRALGYGDSHVVIGKIARLFELKGHDDVIDAASTVIRQCPAVRFLFVGDGIWRERLTARIEAASLSNYFHFTGLVPPEQISELIHAMDIVVHCSLREGLARVLPQALIAGKPVVSYDVDGAREVVLPGSTGFLVPAQAIDQLGQAIVRLAQDPNLRSTYGAEGRRLFTDRFRHDHMVQEIRRVYDASMQQIGKRQKDAAQKNG